MNACMYLLACARVCMRVYVLRKSLSSKKTPLQDKHSNFVQIGNSSRAPILCQKELKPRGTLNFLCLAFVRLSS